MEPQGFETCNIQLRQNFCQVEDKTKKFLMNVDLPRMWLIHGAIQAEYLVFNIVHVFRRKNFSIYGLFCFVFF